VRRAGGGGGGGGGLSSYAIVDLERETYGEDERGKRGGSSENVADEGQLPVCGAWGRVPGTHADSHHPHRPPEGEGDKCNLLFLEACRDVFEGEGEIDRVSWLTCCAQSLLCVAASMAEPPPLIWKNVAAAMEQIQLSSVGDSDAQSAAYASDEATKMTALSKYATAELCKDKMLTSSSDNQGGNAELRVILEMLADAGMPVSCRV